MHRVVEGARAGWVHDWRDIADEHAKNHTAPAATGEDTEEDEAAADGAGNQGHASSEEELV
jgi:hypothetical protein